MWTVQTYSTYILDLHISPWVAHHNTSRLWKEDHMLWSVQNYPHDLALLSNMNPAGSEVFQEQIPH